MFADPILSKQMAQGKLTKSSIDRFTIVLMGGIAAEAINYGSSEVLSMCSTGGFLVGDRSAEVSVPRLGLKFSTSTSVQLSETRKSFLLPCKLTAVYMPQSLTYRR